MNDTKNIKEKLYQHIPTGSIKKVLYINNDYVYFREGTTGYTRYTVENFLKNWKLYTPEDDKVNHPTHYTWLKDLCGIEVIDITRHMDFNLGNSIKYILRSGHKKEEGYTDKQKTIEDLKKAIWYLNDEISMLEKEN